MKYKYVIIIYYKREFHTPVLQLQISKSLKMSATVKNKKIIFNVVDKNRKQRTFPGKV